MKRSILLFSCLLAILCAAVGASTVQAHEGDDSSDDVAVVCTDTGATGATGASIARDGVEDSGEATGSEGVPENEVEDSPESEHINGDDGDDTLAGHGGDDEIHGDRGDDDLCGEDGNDHIRGGRGDDKIDGGAGDDHLEGNSGNDTETGGSGDDVVIGNRGADKLNGGSGHDKIFGGKGNDRINSDDGVRDRVNCGRGRDVVVADKKDSIARNCEKVTRN